MPSFLFVSKRSLADKATLVEINEAAQAHLKGRILLFFDKRFLAAIEVDIDQQQAGFNSRDVECEHARRMNIKGSPLVHERVPDADGVASGYPNLVAEIAGVTCAGNLNGNIGYCSFCDSEVFQIFNVRTGYQAFQQTSGGRTLQCECGYTL